jgi:hypothetical protein
MPQPSGGRQRGPRILLGFRVAPELGEPYGHPPAAEVKKNPAAVELGRLGAEERQGAGSYDDEGAAAGGDKGGSPGALEEALASVSEIGGEGGGGW